MPVAVPRLVMKKWPMAVVAGVTMRDVPVPPRRPKTMRKCQNSGMRSQWEIQPWVVSFEIQEFCYLPVQTPISITLPIINTLPANTRPRGPLASKTGPMKIPHRKVRKM